MRRLAIFVFAFAAATAVFVYLPLLTASCLTAAAVVAAAVAAARSRALRARTIIAAAGLFAGAAWFAVFGAMNTAPNQLDGATVPVLASVLDYPVANRYGFTVSVSARTDYGTVRARMYVSGETRLRPGDEFEADAAFSYERGKLTGTARGQITVTGRAFSLRHLPAEVAHRLAESISGVFPPETAPFMRAMVLGDDTDFTRDTVNYDALSRSGITHIISVSGMHVSFLIAFVSMAVKNKRALAALGIPLLLAFCAVVGFSPAVTRAAVMQSLFLAAPLFSRRPDGVTNVSAALFLLLLCDPFSVAETGLQLSFLSTLGIVMFARRMETAALIALERRGLRGLRGETGALDFVMAAASGSATPSASGAAVSPGASQDNTAQRVAVPRRILRRIVRAVVSSAAVTLAALLFTTPLVAYYFGYVSIASPLTNLATLWASSFAFVGGLIAGLAGLLSQTAGVAAAVVSALPAQWILFAARAITRIPFAAVYVENPYILIWLAYVYAAVAAVVVLRGRLRAAVYAVCGCAVTFCAALLISAAAGAVSGLTVTVLDVGQGQCVAISDGAYNIFIDCGSSNANAAVRADAYLQSHGAVTVDALILTHFHEDHANGALALLSRYAVRTLIVPVPELGEVSALSDEVIALARERKTDIVFVTEQTRFDFGGTAIIAFPPVFDIPDDENSSCISLLVTSGGWDVLITGDMDYYGEIALTEIFELPDIEILVAGHHGSRFSSSYDLLDAVTPEVALISVGDNNYGHPADETLARFEEYGVSVWRTDQSGDLTVRR